MFGMGTGGSSLPSSPLLLYISTFLGSYIYILYLNLSLSEKINNYIANLRKSFFHIAFLSLKLVKIIDYSVMKRFSFSI